MRFGREPVIHRTLVLSVVIAMGLGSTAALPQVNRTFSPKAQARITKEVRHQILMLPDFGVFDNIAFKLDGYDVVLLGQVTQPSLRSDAERAVKRIEGVERVE